MFKYIARILEEFRGCFSRRTTFQWFVLAVIGLCIRTDYYGVTSIVRCLNLEGRCYAKLLHFFRSKGYSLESLTKKWQSVVCGTESIFEYNGRKILIGDGVKQGKDARKMPGVKKQHQESENATKAKYIFGHMFGCISVLAGNVNKLFAVPIQINIQDGVKDIHGWNSIINEDSHCVQLISHGVEAAKTFGKSYLLLDRYFLTVPVLKRLAELISDDLNLLHIVTKAKSNCVGYLEDYPLYSGKGRPRKKGTKVVMKELFPKEELFKKATLRLYGQEQELSYYSIDLLWGNNHYQKLRFVLTVMNGAKSILVTTDLTLSPIQVIELYGFRSKIEACFRELKQVIGAFTYRFWSNAMPRLRRYAKKDDVPIIETVESNRDKVLISDTLKAIEVYVFLSCIAIGIIQLVSLKFSSLISISDLEYQRTFSNEYTFSEANISQYLSRNIYAFCQQNQHNLISKIILQYRKHIDFNRFDTAA